MITAKRFFEPETTCDSVIKWTAICLLILLGLGLLLINLDDLIVYEKACDDPIYVQGTVSVSYNPGSNREFVEKLSYSYNGVEYQDVFYRSVANGKYASEEGKIISVAINPKNPGELLQHMVNSGFVVASLILMCLGIALLVYGIAIENDTFRNWRRTCGAKDAYGERKPRYGMDVLLTFVVVLAVGLVAMCIIFPDYTGLFD